MSVGPTVVRVQLKIYELNEEVLKIRDSCGFYIFVFKRAPNGVALAVGVRGSPAPYKFKIKNDIKSAEELRGLLAQIPDNGIQSCLDDFARELFKAYKAWEERLEDLQLGLEIQRDFEETPLATISTGNGQLTILGTDGYVIPLHGGFIQAGARTFAVMETTYVLARKTVPTKKGGITEIVTVTPLMLIAEYVGGELVRVWAEDPSVQRTIKLFDKIPVRVSVVSQAASTLPTLLDAEVAVKILNREVEVPDFREVFDEVVKHIRRFVNFEWDERLYDVAAAYVVATYFYDFFTAFPKLFYLGPYGSGKTRAMLTCTLLSRHGLVVVDPSKASVYRSIEAFGPTLGIDESALDGGLLKIIAAGYKRGLKVPRVDKNVRNVLMVALFESYCPTILAFTEPLKEIGAQRAICVNMYRARDPSPERRDPEPHDFEETRRKLYALRLLGAKEFIEAMEKVREEISKEFTERDYEIWYPLLTAAYLGGKDHYEKVLAYAREDVASRKASLYSEEKIVLAAIEQLLGDKESVAFQAKDLHNIIVDFLVDNEGYTENQVKRLWKPEKIGRVLRRLGLRSKSTRTEKGARYVYEIDRKTFMYLAERYGYTPQHDVTDNYNCSKCSRCSKFFEDQESGSTETSVDETEKREPEEEKPAFDSSGREKTTVVSEKPTTPTTPTTTNDTEQSSINDAKRLGVLEAIEAVLREHGKMTFEDLYDRLVDLVTEGKLVVATLSADQLVEHLRYLEEQGRVKRFFDEQYGRVFYYVPQGW